jgi:hypothetical protein
VSDPRLLPDGTRDPSLCPPYLETENIRGRYALHFHHVGERTAPNRHVVEGVAISVRKLARLKFGVISHSSNVSVSRSVSVNIDGSHFMTEEGNEIGEFRDNLAVFSFGSNAPNEDQPRDVLLNNGGCSDLVDRRRSDQGHNGSGFWIHSGGVDTIGNVAAGHTNAGFDMWTIPLSNETDRPNAPPFLRFEVRYLRPGSTWPFEEETMHINRVPGLFRNNVAYAAGFQRNGRKAGFALSTGMQAHKNPSLGKTLVDGFLAWNVVQGVDSEYTGMTDWRNLRLIAGTRADADSQGVDLARQDGNHNDVSNSEIVGFATCIRNDGWNSTTSNVTCTGGPVTTPPPPAPPAAPGNVRIIR